MPDPSPPPSPPTLPPPGSFPPDCYPEWPYHDFQGTEDCNCLYDLAEAITAEDVECPDCLAYNTTLAVCDNRWICAGYEMDVDCCFTEHPDRVSYTLGEVPGTPSCFDEDCNPVLCSVDPHFNLITRQVIGHDCNGGDVIQWTWRETCSFSGGFTRSGIYWSGDCCNGLVRDDNTVSWTYAGSVPPIGGYGACPHADDPMDFCNSRTPVEYLAGDSCVALVDSFRPPPFGTPCFDFPTIPTVDMGNCYTPVSEACPTHAPGTVGACIPDTHDAYCPDGYTLDPETCACTPGLPSENGELDAVVNRSRTLKYVLVSSGSSLDLYTYQVDATTPFRWVIADSDNIVNHTATSPSLCRLPTDALSVLYSDGPGTIKRGEWVSGQGLKNVQSVAAGTMGSHIYDRFKRIVVALWDDAWKVSVGTLDAGGSSYTFCTPVAMTDASSASIGGVESRGSLEVLPDNTIEFTYPADDFTISIRRCRLLTDSAAGAWI